MTTLDTSGNMGSFAIWGDYADWRDVQSPVLEEGENGCAPTIEKAFHRGVVKSMSIETPQVPPIAKSLSSVA